MEKRFYLGLVILGLLLALGVGASVIMQVIHKPVADKLYTAADLALQDKMDEALALSKKAYDRWQRFHSFTASFADHSPMDDTDTLFQEMLVYAEAGEAPHFAACCAQLSAMLKAIYETHSFSLKNIF